VRVLQKPSSATQAEAAPEGEPPTEGGDPAGGASEVATPHGAE
jgi:hypothetical protein